MQTSEEYIIQILEFVNILTKEKIEEIIII